MNTWKVILATLVIFGAGVMTGGLLEGYSARCGHGIFQPSAAAGNPPGQKQTAVAAPEGKPAAPLPAPLRKEFLARLNTELNLDDSQREHIEKILCEGQDKTKKIWQTVEPEMRAAFKETREKICRELQGGQKAKFDEMLNLYPAGSGGKPTNAPASTSTNSASLNPDAVFCLIFGFKPPGCSTSSAGDAAHCQSQSDQKTPLPPRTEPGS